MSGTPTFAPRLNWFDGQTVAGDRASVPERFKWNLADLYPSDEAWRQEKAALVDQLPLVEAYKGRLGSSPGALADALEAVFGLQKSLGRLLVYASMVSDEDTRHAGHQGMRQEISQLGASARAAMAFFEPELLRQPAGALGRMLQHDPRLKMYEFYLRDLERRAAHTLSEPEEKLLADLGPLADNPSQAYGLLANADLPFPTITLSDGQEVRLDHAAYTRWRSTPDRSDRERVMSTFFGALGGFSRTFGMMMNGALQAAGLVARARRYPSHLAYRLDGTNIPTAVYHRLLEAVNRNLGSFHRYLRLRRRMLGVSQLHYFDIYAPLVGSMDRSYTPAEAEALSIASVAPLGADYQAVVRRAFVERWIDVFPTPGKRSGAYSEGAAYDVHPYILLNYNGRYTDVSTLAHELGHTMHSYLSNRTQPYPLADYPIFVAEVASTFNEALLLDHMLSTTDDVDDRLALLGSYLEHVKATVFRQTQFAEFELRMHEMSERGEAITGEALSTLYLDITRRYYGHADAVTIVDDHVAHEWSYIPHFYSDFYVFQYATSFTASEALVEKLRAGVPGARERVLTFLSSGGSKYPIDLLRDAGVDMTTDEPFDLTMRTMNRVMDEIERILETREN